MTTFGICVIIIFALFLIAVSAIAVSVSLYRECKRIRRNYETICGLSQSKIKFLEDLYDGNDV